MKNDVFRIISQVFGIRLNEVDEQSSMDNVVSWDSLRQINLILALEDEYSVEFTDAEVAAMTSAKSVLETLKKHCVTDSD